MREETANEMTRVQYPDIDPIRGLGFAVIEDEDVKFAAHSGGFYGCSTQLWLELNRDLGVIILTNGEAQGRAMSQMLGRLFKEALKMSRAD